MTKYRADANPEKRLFISLITRDISLIDAFLDIIDNSINAALEPLAASLRTADDYQRLLATDKTTAKVAIEIRVNSSRITVSDTAHGIQLETAKDQVFKFGRSANASSTSDRLSVYGLGLKRAMFKCGNNIHITSDHQRGGFELKLDVAKWAKEKASPWQFDITDRAPTKKNCGTQIVISELYPDVSQRLDDGLFLDQLRDRVSRTYSFFIGRVVNITINGRLISSDAFEIGQNYTSKKFVSGKVSCNITAGIAATPGEAFRDRNAGWFVFCNGRAVLFADKSLLTGWGGAGLPIFQPKHRPFMGTVFFVSTDPEALPWTTTKASVNEESNVWQEAKRQMVTVGRVVIGFLDKRYTSEGTDIAPSDLREAIGGSMSVLAAATAKARDFKPPTKPPPKTQKIQYDAKVADIRRIEEFLRQKMGGSEVGRHTFNHFLKNVVGDSD